MIWPRYRNRYLPSMSAAKIRALPDKERATVVLPTGAIEQHGPQLPVGVDALLGQVYLDRALPKLPEQAPVYVAPPIQAGKSNEHTGFPGTIILSRESLRQMVLSAGHQIASWGFKRIGILNTHGGNISVVKSALRELNMELGLTVEVINYSYIAEISARESAYGIHAGEVESSLMYAATPDLVEPEKATSCWIGSLDPSKQLKPEFAPATYAWMTLDVSQSGVCGDATIATKEKGELWLERAADALAKRLMELVES